MSLQGYSFLFDAISAVGVIASILYLGYQIRQNTRAMRRTVSRDIVRDLNELGRFFIEKPELIQIHFKANEEPETMNREDQFRYQVLVMNLFSNLDLAIGYHKDGLISEQSVETYSHSINQVLSNPIVKEWWQGEGRALYSAELRDLVEKQLAA